MKKFILSFILIIPLLYLSVPALAQNVQHENLYSVLFNDKAIPPDFDSEVESYGGKLIYAVPEIGFAQIKGDSNVFSQLRSLSSVRAASPSITWPAPQVKGTELLSLYSENAVLDAPAPWWDINRVTNDGESYKLGVGSHDVVVGIIDSGIDTDHADLEGNLLPGSKNFAPEFELIVIDGKHQYIPSYDEKGNLVIDPTAIEDLTGHGTHVAGTIAANETMKGIAPEVGIRAYRIFGPPGTGAESVWVFKALVTAADDEVDVINMSLSSFDIKGQAFFTDPETGKKISLGNDVADFLAWKRAVQYAADKGCLVVTAAGNGPINVTNKKEVTDYLNANFAPIGYHFVGAGFEVPGTIPGVITVSATGLENDLAIYSNYGPGFIDAAAPGGGAKIFARHIMRGEDGLNDYMSEGLFTQEWCLSTWNNGGHFWNMGTSMATPKVSAVAALMIDKYGKMEPAKLAKMLREKAVEPVNGKEQSYFGSGHINAVHALTN